MSDKAGLRFWCEYPFGFFLVFKIYSRHSGWCIYWTTERICVTLSRFYFATGLDYRPKIIPYYRILNKEAMYLFKKPKKQDK